MRAQLTNDQKIGLDELIPRSGGQHFKPHDKRKTTTQYRKTVGGS
ncbi:hypothetical protein [Ktedonospora formicarum]|nr:hypothetical protein [Ktedonospora formicarum]